MTGPGSSAPRIRLAVSGLGAVIATAAVLRFYKLDSPLWLDEVSALVGSYRNTFWETLTKFPGHFPHPLYEQLAHGCLRLFGETPFAIRLPAALFGIASVGAFYRLARRTGSHGEALLAAALLAVSYHHMYFSQNARGYTTYLFFAIAGTGLLLSLLHRMRWQTGLAYAVVAALAAYSQTAGLLLAPTQIAVAYTALRWAPRSSHQPNGRQLLGVLAISLGLVVLLYGPLIADALHYTSVAAAEEPPIGRGARLFDLATEAIKGVVPAFSHWTILLGVLIIGGIGTYDFARRQPLPLLLLIAPVVASVGVMALLGGAMHARYFLLLLAVCYLLGTRGLVCIVHYLSLRLAVPRLMLRVASVAFVSLAAIPLVQYFSVPKQDFMGALHYVRSVAKSGDRAVAADLAAHVYQKYYAPELPAVENLTDLLEEEASANPVWVITTFETIELRRRPDLIAHLHREYQLARTFPASTSGGEMRVYFRPGRE